MGMKASGALGNSVDASLPVNQGWNIGFYPNAMIYKSPYIQNCTNFSDSQIDNSNINVITPAAAMTGRAFPNVSIYVAAKAAVLSFTGGLAAEVGPLGINVNAISPRGASPAFYVASKAPPEFVQHVREAA